jgi:hypothetical protein
MLVVVAIMNIARDAAFSHSNDEAKRHVFA